MGIAPAPRALVSDYVAFSDDQKLFATDFVLRPTCVPGPDPLANCSSQAAKPIWRRLFPIGFSEKSSRQPGLLHVLRRWTGETSA